MNKGSVEDGVVFHAGFPNAAEDQKFGSLNLDSLLVRRRVSTYFWTIESDVPELQWSKGDIAVVDRALSLGEGKIGVVTLENDFVLARLHNKRLERLDGAELEGEANLWGVVTYVIHKT